jgi:hypothetical protein
MDDTEEGRCSSMPRRLRIAGHVLQAHAQDIKWLLLLLLLAVATVLARMKRGEQDPPWCEHGHGVRSHHAHRGRVMGARSDVTRRAWVPSAAARKQESKQCACASDCELALCAERRAAGESLRAATDGEEHQAMLLRSDAERVQGGEEKEERCEATRIFGCFHGDPQQTEARSQLVSVLSSAEAAERFVPARQRVDPSLHLKHRTAAPFSSLRMSTLLLFVLSNWSSWIT